MTTIPRIVAAVALVFGAFTFAPSPASADWGQEDYSKQICVPGNPPYALAVESRNEESYYRSFGAVDFVNTVDGCGGLTELYTDEKVPVYVPPQECAGPLGRVGALQGRVDSLERKVDRKDARIDSLRARVERLRERLHNGR